MARRKGIILLPTNIMISPNGGISAQAFIKTTDDWHPNFNQDEVLLRISTGLFNEGEIWHRVSVWGADDTGMEKDFYRSPSEALKTFYEVRMLKTVTKKILEDLGFKYC